MRDSWDLRRIVLTLGLSGVKVVFIEGFVASFKDFFSYFGLSVVNVVLIEGFLGSLKDF